VAAKEDAYSYSTSILISDQEQKKDCKIAATSIYAYFCDAIFMQALIDRWNFWADNFPIVALLKGSWRAL
jgi:predicted oxidoreductase (fatty acid repression mutant protein)